MGKKNNILKIKDINMPLDEFISNIVKDSMREVRKEFEEKSLEENNDPNISILEEVPSTKLSGLITEVYRKYKDKISRIVRAEYIKTDYGRKKRVQNILIETTGKWNKTYGNIVNSGLLCVTTHSTYIETHWGLNRSELRIYEKKNGIVYIEFLNEDLDAVAAAFALGIIHDEMNKAYDITVDFIQACFRIDLENIDFIGYDDVIKKCNNILRCKDDRVVNRHIMLYGKPGNGKSMLAKKIALENPEYIPITINVQCHWEKWIPMISELIKKTNKKLIVVFDEIDELGLNRDQNREKVYELLRLLDGTTDLKNIKFIATTNRPQDLDVALLRVGRFSPMHIGPPDLQQRKKIMEYYIKKYDFKDINTSTIIKKIPEETSGAILRGCIEDCIINNQERTGKQIVKNLEENIVELEKISDIADVMYS